jgi:hypothetical protein
MELPVGIRNALKGNNNGNLPSAALLADEGDLDNLIILDSGKVSNTIQVLGISEIGRHPEITDLSQFQVGTSEVGVLHDTFSHRSLFQIGSTEISSGKITFGHRTPSQVSPTEVSIGEVSSTQIGSTQIRSTEVNITQINLDKEILFRNGASDHYPTQVNFSEVSVPRSIEPAKFISSHFLHDNTPLLNTIDSTAQTLTTIDDRSRLS